MSSYISIISHSLLNLSRHLLLIYCYLHLSTLEANWQSIAQFSTADADAYVKYETFLGTKPPSIMS